MLKEALSFHQKGQLAEAAALYRQILAQQPQNADALHLLGVIEAQTNNPAKALELIDRAITLQPSNAWFFTNRGIALAKLKRFAEALSSFDRAIFLKPDLATAHDNRGFAQQELQRFEDALTSFDSALAIQPNLVSALNNRGFSLQQLKRFDEALASYDRALDIDPNDVRFLGARLFCKMQMAKWKGQVKDVHALSKAIAAGRYAAEPFPIMATSLSGSLLRTCAETYIREKCPDNNLGPFTRAYEHDRIRLGYFSTDFNVHPTSILMAHVFECHDRSKFEATAFSFGPARDDAMRKRLEKSFDHFLDVGHLSDRDIALLAREREVDIAIDLKGFTQDSRTGIFAMRAAPIQVNYLGYPGTMGASYIDYAIADRIVIPEDQQDFYREKIAYLPDAYLPTDSTRVVPANRFSRADCGLPEDGFVFCSFNNNYKIAPPMFDIWMRLLKAVKGSVLWLLEDNAFAAKNFRAEAQARGVDPRRLVFASRVDLSDHLARHELADLFLDTLPYNAHTTATDALWMGLPLVTCVGQTFVGRVAASVLQAAGFPELIAHDLKAYEKLALELATNKQKLLSLRENVLANRVTHPLFDTRGFTKHIESAYTAMWKQQRAGLKPEHIAVQRLKFKSGAP